QVRCPAVHVAQQRAEGHITHQVNNVAVRLALGGVVVVHQQHAGKGQHDKQVEGDAAHSPGVVVAHRVAVDLGRVQVQEDIGKHTQGAAAGTIVVLNAEDGFEEGGLLRLLEALEVLFRFSFENLGGLAHLVENGGEPFLGRSFGGCFLGRSSAV